MGFRRDASEAEEVGGWLHMHQTEPDPKVLAVVVAQQRRTRSFTEFQ